MPVESKTVISVSLVRPALLPRISSPISPARAGRTPSLCGSSHSPAAKHCAVSSPYTTAPLSTADSTSCLPGRSAPIQLRCVPGLTHALFTTGVLEHVAVKTMSPALTAAAVSAAAAIVAVRVCAHAWRSASVASVTAARRSAAFSGRCGFVRYTVWMDGIAASAAAARYGQSSPQPTIVSVFASLRARYFAPTAAAAPVRSAVMGPAFKSAFGFPVARSKRSDVPKSAGRAFSAFESYHETTFSP